MQKGNIGVTTENIFPVIKKFLYSDHEIFLREMVSNAVDATQKLKTLAQQGEFKGDLGDLTVHVSLDADKGTLTISDRGIGMTEEEIDKYINQIAFSGVNDFLEKYKDNANNIIGHFGLGFYSSFMVSKKVEIVTKSYKEGAKAVKWSCDGSPAYEIDEAEREDRGSDIILYIDDDCKEFLEKEKIQQLLNKYSKFMAVPVAFGKKQEWSSEEKKMVDTDKDNIINGRTHVLDSPECGLSFQPDRYSILPTHQVQHRPAAQQDPTVLQPGVRHGPGGGYRTRVSDPAAWCHRLAGHSSERQPFILAKRPRGEENLDLYH